MQCTSSETATVSSPSARRTSGIKTSSDTRASPASDCGEPQRTSSEATSDIVWAIDPRRDVEETIGFLHRLKKVSPECEVLIFMYTPVPQPGQLFADAALLSPCDSYDLARRDTGFASVGAGRLLHLAAQERVAG